MWSDYYPAGVHPAHFEDNGLDDTACETPGVECQHCGFEQFGYEVEYNEGEPCPECGEPLVEMSHEKKCEKILSRQDDGVED